MEQTDDDLPVDSKAAIEIKKKAYAKRKFEQHKKNLAKRWEKEYEENSQ